MYRYLATTLIVLVLASTSANALRLSEPVQKDETSETFGSVINVLPEQVKISQLLSAPQAYQNKEFSLQAKVSKVCQKKGCFFIAQQEEQLIRVAFKDYGFFVPTSISGRTVTLVGELVSHQLSAKQAIHLNQDLGEDGNIQSGLVYEIVATSVRVANKK